MVYKMSSLLLSTSTSQLFRSTTLPSPSSPSLSPKSDDIVMEFPSSPPFLPHDIPSTPTTPGPGGHSSFNRSSYRPPNSARRTRRIPHVNTDPYPTTAMHQSTRRLSSIPTDNDVEVAYRNMSDYEGSGNMSPATRRRLPNLPTRSVFHDSTIQGLNQSGQLLSPLPIRGGTTMVPPPAPRTNTAADDLNETLAQAIKLLSLEKKPESYPSTSESSQSSPHASSTTSYADDAFQQYTSSSAIYSSPLPDPEELLKEIVRNSLQSLHALRLAKAMERDIRSSRRGSTEDGMDVESSHIGGQDNSGTAVQVVAYLEQSVSTINSARQYIEFAEETLSDTRDRVRDGLLKG